MATELATDFYNVCMKNNLEEVKKFYDENKDKFTEEIVEFVMYNLSLNVDLNTYDHNITKYLEEKANELFLNEPAFL